MSSVILTNWTVYYADDASAGNGYKQIRWTGAGGPETNTNSVNQLYSAIADLFSSSSQNDADDTIPMRAVTPTVYEVGSFDSGDLEPWFIDPVSIEHLTGGSLETSGWTRSLPGDGTGDTGIVVITRSGTNIVSGDVGAAITHDVDGDSGTLLYIDGSSLWIRPDSNALADDWDSTSGNITCNSHTDSQTAAGVTGERVWANAYTLGTITSNTTLAVYQNFTELTPFWSSGHIDRLFLTNDGFSGGLVDEGLLTIFARQFTKLYDHFTADLSSGGRNPIPLATFNDTNNTSGYRQMVLTTASADFTVGEIIQDDSDATIQGIVTSNTGTAPNLTLRYYLIGPNLADFTSGTGAFTGQSSSSTGTAVDPTDVNSAAVSTITITFGATSQDILNGNGPQPYDVTIDCGGETLVTTYRYLQFLTRRGSATSVNGHEGAQYTGIGDIRFDYDNEAVSNFIEGETVTGTGTPTPTGVITSVIDNGSDGTLVLHDVRGNDFTNNMAILGNSSSTTAQVNGTYETLPPTKQAPFGTFGGGTFFGARGVHLSNMAPADASNYILTDSLGVEQIPPSYVNLTILNLAAGDRVGMFRATGDNNVVNKSMYTIQQAHSAPVTYIRISESIPSDTPQSGRIRVVRRDGSGKIIDEQRYYYSGYSNANQPTYSEFTMIGTTVVDYDTDDTVYVPYIDELIVSGTSTATAIIYVTDRYVTTRIRRKGFLPFVTKGQITSAGLSVTAVKNVDTITD